MRVVLLDNRDSFVYNLVDQFATLGAQTEVYRNTVPAERLLRALEPTAAERQAGTRPVLCLSPGPGHPLESGCLIEVLEAALERGIPTIGICLGFQAMVEACGGSIGRVGPVHGRSIRVDFTEAGLSDPAFAASRERGHAGLEVARYHSLGTRSLPEGLVTLAVTAEDDPAQPGIVMAARHRRLPMVGVQFHPESILTPTGPLILRSLIAELAQASHITQEHRIMTSSLSDGEQSVTASPSVSGAPVGSPVASESAAPALTSFAASLTPEALAEQAGPLLRSVIQGAQLEASEAELVFTALSQGLFSEVETAALLAALRARGESAQELTGAACAFRAAAMHFPQLDVPLFDIVGTGGDGVGTINLSTAAGITAASMGLAVAKHGNRAVSSKTGAADVIAELGLPLGLAPEAAAEQLRRTGFTFLFAQSYHPAMRFVAPIRAILKTPTIFNLLGPLINPAQLSYQVLGVADASRMDLMASTLHQLGRERALVINGLGLDEITVHGVTSVREVSREGVREYEVTPEELGVQRHELSEMLGGDPARNAAILREVFAGRGEAGYRDAVAVNAGALLYLAGRAASLAEGTAAALERLASGAVAEHLEVMTGSTNTAEATHSESEGR